MCLATVYKENDDSVIFKNVSRINVDGNKLVLRDIMGDERVNHPYGRPCEQYR